jgi:predicted metal-dependent phosphoesterase TrpH
MSELAPKVVLSGAETPVTLRPGPEEPPLDPEREYEVRLLPMEEGTAEPVEGGRRLKLRAEGGAVRFSAAFAGEQEYRVVLFGADPEQALGRASLYSVRADLFARRPYKGDVHMHSRYSDGLDEPGALAAHNRRLGLDFMALTDHRLYAPSLEAAAAFGNLPLDLRIYPGEEVHPPDSQVHFVNFGGSFSVQERFAEPAYLEEIARLVAVLPDLPAGVSPYIYASSLWTLAKIREAGGLAIFCHPYWIWRDEYNVPEALIERLFADSVFDAYEVLGGFDLSETESNALQVARYYSEAARGRQVPVVGDSDGHGFARGLHGWYYTVALAESSDFADLRQAIVDQYAVAVEGLPGAPAARAYGPFRLVKYVSFLLREVFPLHDELCIEEGEWMAAHLAGDAAAAPKLAELQGRTAALYDRLWAG